MSTVVNGLREDESATHTRPHGHILPMLSFSASTPTDEDNPLDNNQAIAIDVTLWEQPEDVVAASVVSDLTPAEEAEAERVPLIDVGGAVVLIDGPRVDDDDEPDENAPLLAGGSRGGGRGRGGGSGGRSGSGGGGGGCSDDGDSGVGGLGIPFNMPRSPEEPGDQLENDLEVTSEGELREVASQIVNEVLNQAQVQATKTNADSKEEAAVAATAVAGGGGSGGAQNLASPTSTHAERIFRGGPWYVQMGRVFSTFLSRICPCRCPTKP